jgi:hypothetical protein
MLEIKSHKTKAGKGSNRKLFGARVFQPRHSKVQRNIIKKNPIEPMWSVTLTAIFSKALRLSLCPILTFCIGFRSFLKSSLSFQKLFFVHYPPLAWLLNVLSSTAVVGCPPGRDGQSLRHRWLVCSCGSGHISLLTSSGSGTLSGYRWLFPQ